MGRKKKKRKEEKPLKNADNFGANLASTAPLAIGKIESKVVDGGEFEIREEQAPTEAIEVRSALKERGRAEELLKLVAQLQSDAAYFANFLADRDWKVRRAALKALIKLKSPLTKEFIEFALTDENIAVQEVAKKLSE
ncbi:MAG: hypothetical protein Kow0090_13840 [Myxococcota bacterium]